MKQIVKSIMARTPYRIVRNKGMNRFLAIEQSLAAMRDRGFRPRLVIDGGAYLGTFSLAAKTIFPDASFHLIEPQPACAALLRSVCDAHDFTLHQYALTDRVGTVKFQNTSAPSTGAHLNPAEEDETIFVASSTLDAIFSSSIHSDARALLKLDLQGAELSALRGASTVLRSIEAILTEVSFVHYGPSIASLVGFLDDHGFELYEVASLAGRSNDNRLEGGDLIFARKDTELASR